MNDDILGDFTWYVIHVLWIAVGMAHGPSLGVLAYEWLDAKRKEVLWRSR